MEISAGKASIGNGDIEIGTVLNSAQYPDALWRIVDAWPGRVVIEDEEGKRHSLTPEQLDEAGEKFGMAPITSPPDAR